MDEDEDEDEDEEVEVEVVHVISFRGSTSASSTGAHAVGKYAVVRDVCLCV